MAIKSLLNSWLGWVFGVLIGVFIISFWRNEKVDWGHFITLNIGGLIGTVIVLGLKKAVKNAESKNQN